MTALKIFCQRNRRSETSSGTSERISWVRKNGRRINGYGATPKLTKERWPRTRLEAPLIAISREGRRPRHGALLVYANRPLARQSRLVVCR